MCGILGFWTNNPKKGWHNRKNFLMQALYTGTMRGSDGTGLALVKEKPVEGEDKVTIFKKPIPGYDFLNLKPLDKLLNNVDEYKIAIGHNRHATKGSLTTANTHPFQHKHITLVHNGHLTTGFDIDKEWYKFPVDSEFICYAIAEYGYKTVLEKLDGAAALVWYDEKEDSLFLYRNKERPLFFCEVKGEDTVLFASELLMIKYLADRTDIELDKCWDVGENQLIILKDKKDVSKQAIKIKPYEKPKPSILDFPNRRADKKAKKELTKSQSEDFLASKNMKIGEEIEFVFDIVATKDPKSRHGRLEGYMESHPYCDVVCEGIAVGRFKRDAVLKGSIYWVRTTDFGHALVVRDLKETGEIAQYTTRPGKGNSTLLLPHVEEEGNKNDPPIIGPNRRLIPRSVYNEYVKHGCCKCSGDITPDDATRIDWLGNSPICAWCVKAVGSLLC